MTRENQTLIEILSGVTTWTGLKIKLEQFNTSKTETTSKTTFAGKIFEVFSKYYFQAAPKQIDLYKDVWLYNEIPTNISINLNLPSVDNGIDLLLRDFDDNFYAVQCKFKNDETKLLSWSGDKIANVFALGTNCQKVIVFTNASDTTNVAKGFADKFIQIAFDELESIEPIVFESILNIAKGNQPIEIKKYSPLPHQITAIDDVVKYFENNKNDGRGQLILPCGAGKSLTALWIKEAIKPTTTLVLVPSLALLKQIKNDWARHKNSHYKYICICSEKDIDKDRKDDEVEVHTYEIGSPVTTNANDLISFLKKTGDKVVFSTYQSLEVTKTACEINHDLIFDLIICDEAHRTTGSKNKSIFTLVHYDYNIRASKRLYMTATPRVVEIGTKNKMGDDYEKLLCDMSNPKIYGTEAHRLSFGKAIEDEILVDYKIIGVGVTDKDVKKYIDERNFIGKISADELAHNFALDFVMNKHQAFHCISFHSLVEKAKEFAERHKTYFEETFSESVNGKQSTTTRTRVLRDFKNSKKGLVSNARCLTEGVDVPTIDIIYFCDPKSSKIDIVQASGRALRKDHSGIKKLGYIVVPIFHHSNQEVETEIKKKPIFNYLIQVIRSLCDQDERLEAEINNIAYKKGKRSNSKIEIEFTDAETEKIIKIEGFEKKIKDAIFDEIINKTKVSWEVFFKEFVEAKKTRPEWPYISKEQDETKSLGIWCMTQRERKRKGILYPEREKRLTEVGFSWIPNDEKWERKFRQLIEYKERFKRTTVTTKDFEKYPEYYELHHWIRLQKRNGQKSSYLAERKKRLEEIGFDFSSDDVKGSWLDFFNQLKEYKNEFGDCNVPQIGKTHKQLGRWLNDQRHKYGKEKLLDDRKKLLNDLGVIWNIIEFEWELKFQDLKKYFSQHGDFDVKQSDTEYKGLYNWLYKIRKNGVSTEKKKRFDEIDFDFTDNKRANWYDMFNQLAKFKEINGHTNIPIKYPKNQELAKWVLAQKVLQRKNELDKEKLDILNAINFQWTRQLIPAYVSANTRNPASWYEMFEKLKNYKLKNGNFNIPKNYPQDQELSIWIYYQKQLNRDNKLSEEKTKAFKDIEFTFPKPKENQMTWEERFEELLQFKTNNGHCKIPIRYKKNPQLATWVRTQRRGYVEGTINPDKKKKLESVGFIWKATE